MVSTKFFISKPCHSFDLLAKSSSAGLDALFDPESNYDNEEDVDSAQLRGTEEADGAACDAWRFLAGGALGADLVNSLHSPVRA